MAIHKTLNWRGFDFLSYIRIKTVSYTGHYNAGVKTYATYITINVFNNADRTEPLYEEVVFVDFLTEEQLAIPELYNVLKLQPKYLGAEDVIFDQL